MNAEEPRPDGDESILTWLVACDKAMAEGTPPQQPPDGDSKTPMESRPRLQGDLACIQMLRQVLQRRSTSEMPLPPAPLPAADLPFQQLGRFQLRRLLGQGAFGMVFLAADPQLGRDVALKVPRPETLLTGELRERFVREARAAAGLDHPNLVPVYEASAVGPLCYIASAYCPGITLSEWLKGRSELPPVRLAARLVATLADAVSHAHARGVIHRDLKPSNVLLQGQRRHSADLHSTVKQPDGAHSSDGAAGPAAGATDGELVPRITDFGLAKLTADMTTQPGETVGTVTQTGAVLGTPNYMAPEQASGKTKEIGPAADIYALGVILYELLTGRPPFRGDSLLDTLEQVRTREPLPPSRLRPKLPRDVETICLKCLQKEPRKRYDSAAALAEDLRRYLAGQPIQARPIRAWERALKWARRRPALAALWVVSILGPLALATVVLAYDAKVTDTNAQLRNANVGLKEALLDAHRYSYVSDMNLAQHDWAAARVERLRELLQRQIPQRGEPDLLGFEWHYWQRLANHSARRTLDGHTGQVWCVACSPDGKLLASGGMDGALRLWDAATGQELGVLDSKFPQPVTAVAFAEGGGKLAAAWLDGTVRLWDVASRKERQTLPEGRGTVLALAGAGERPILAVSRFDATVRADSSTVEIWGLGEQKPRHTLRAHKERVRAVAFSADGRMLASGDYDGILHLWDVGTGKLLGSYLSQQKGINGVAFSPDGKQLAAACNDATIRLWDWKENKERILVGHTRAVWSIQYAPDGKTLVSTGADATVRLWEADGTPRFALKGHTGEVRGAVFTPDGRTIVSAGVDRLLKLWDAHRNPEYSSWRGHDRAVQHLAFAPKGDVLATGGEEGFVQLWEPATGRRLAILVPYPPNLSIYLAGRMFGGCPLSPKPIQGLAFTPDGKHLAVACLDPFVHIYDRQTAKEVARLAGHSLPVTAVAFSPDGKLLASGGNNGSVCIWDWLSQKTMAECAGQKRGIRALAFSPDGKLLASSSTDHTIKFWQPETGRLRATLARHKKTVWGLAFSPDGRTLASGSEDKTVRLWDVDSANERMVLPGHAGSVRSLAFSPDDGRTLASTSGEVKLWQTATGRELATFTDRGKVWSVTWAPDRRLLAGGGDNGAITLWDAGEAGW